MRRAALASLLLATASCGLSIVGTDTPDGSAAPEAGPSADASVDVTTPAEDATAVREAGDDAGNDANADADADASADADAGKAPLVYGADCPNGTTYDDDFSTDPKSRWIQVSGTWVWDSVQKTYATTAGMNPSYGLAWIGARPNWKNYSVEVTFTGSQIAGSDHADMGPLYRIGDIGTGTPPPINSGSMYMSVVSFNTNADVIFSDFQNTTYNSLDTADAAPPPLDKTKTMVLRVELTGSTIKTLVNGKQVLSDTDAKYAAGGIGLRVYQGTFIVHHVVVTCPP